jgi:hypothetical protein
MKDSEAYMDILIFEDNIRYDAGIKLVLVFSLVLLIVLGILFFIDGHHSNIFLKRAPQRIKDSLYRLMFFYGFDRGRLLVLSLIRPSKS